MTDLRSTTERVSDTLRTVAIAVCERHYPRDCLVLRVSRLHLLPVYVHYSFVAYTCLQSTSPYALPTPLRTTSHHESLRVARRLSVTFYELPRYTTIGFFITETPSTAVASVTGWSRVPRKTTCPHLSGYISCWLEVPSTTDKLLIRSMNSSLDIDESGSRNTVSYGILSNRTRSLRRYSDVRVENFHHPPAYTDQASSPYTTSQSLSAYKTWQQPTHLEIFPMVEHRFPNYYLVIEYYSPADGRNARLQRQQTDAFSSQ